MFAVQFQARFSDRAGSFAGDDGRPCERGEEPVVCFSRSLAEALCGLAEARGWVRPSIVDVGDKVSPRDLVRWS